MEETPRVCSIQSHVVYGYVGNKSATFPLQLLGFEVDAINSVQFSNHTGYAVIKGQVLTDKDFDDLVEGLIGNNLDVYTHLLTGYVGSLTFLDRIANFVKHVKAKNPNLIFVCDPVMGDNGRMYVPAELLPTYSNVLAPLADILTPNQYEIELLTGCTIKTIDDAWQACDILHDRGCKTVVLSSTNLGDTQHFLALASSRIGEGMKLTISIPKLDASFTGSGDLFTSLLLAWSHKTGNNIKLAMEKTVATMQKVLQRTEAYAKAKGVCPKNLELQLIQSKQDIEKPHVEIFAKGEACDCKGNKDK
ncbi:Pdxk [Trypoxylus dichotomus]